MPSNPSPRPSGSPILNLGRQPETGGPRDLGSSGLQARRTDDCSEEPKRLELVPPNREIPTLDAALGLLDDLVQELFGRGSNAAH
jgi:hypothetical protein